MPETNETGARLWDLLMRITPPLVFVLGAAIIGHEVRIAVIESTKFMTQHQGDELEKKIVPLEWLRSEAEESKKWRMEIDRKVTRLIAEVEDHLRMHEK